MQVINEIYPYFIAKHLDLLDTVFFVLRKKDNQITFLHLYHHSAMVSWTWLHLMHHPTDHFVLVGLLNSFVHVLMYAYYGISALGPEYAKFVWWKKHLTKVQLVCIFKILPRYYYNRHQVLSSIVESSKKYCFDFFRKNVTRACDHKSANPHPSLMIHLFVGHLLDKKPVSLKHSTYYSY